LERRALAFRGRSALGAFAPAGSPLDSLFPQESRTPAPINMFKNLDRTPFAYSLFCFKIDLLKFEVMRMLSKHHLQRDQLEMITLDQLVPANHLVRKMEASIDPVIIKM
jgi:hypothetical protein